MADRPLQDPDPGPDSLSSGSCLRSCRQGSRLCPRSPAPPSPPVEAEDQAGSPVAPALVRPAPWHLAAGAPTCQGARGLQAWGSPVLSPTASPPPSPLPSGASPGPASRPHNGPLSAGTPGSSVCPPGSGPGEPPPSSALPQPLGWLCARTATPSWEGGPPGGPACHPPLFPCHRPPA